jgi:ubiquitin-conjugating enzyme E2 D/E
MAKATPKRLENEFKQISSSSVCGCTVLLENDLDLKNWTILMQGPEQTPYEGGVFRLKFTFPDNYPFKAPDVKFITNVYHPNIKTDTGEICQDVFASSWAPTQKVSDILEKIVSMLRQPSTSTPLEPEICNEYTNNNSLFNQKAREFTQKYANA